LSVGSHGDNPFGQLQKKPHQLTPPGVQLLSCAPHVVLTHVGDLVVLLLAHAPENRLRFSEIKRGVQSISHRMLTLALPMLERNGLILRHY
jgi:DNA-binding HxlR family transcriptional regulator